MLYVVPWKRSDLGDLAGKPANSLLDEVLAPVDRDVFKRQNRYYDALKPDAAGGRTAGGRRVRNRSQQFGCFGYKVRGVFAPLAWEF